MEKLKITIIEKDENIARILNMNLEKSGYIVSQTFDSAEEAMNSLDDDSSDVIIADVKTESYSNSSEMAEKIRSSVSTPIVFYSQQANQQIENKCLSLNNTKFILKTSPMQTLICAIQEVIMESFGMQKA